MIGTFRSQSFRVVAINEGLTPTNVIQESVWYIAYICVHVISNCNCMKDTTIPIKALYHLFITGSLRTVFGPTHADENTLFSTYSEQGSANNYFKQPYSPVHISTSNATESEKSLCTPPDSKVPHQGCLRDLRLSENATLANTTLDIYLQFLHKRNVLSELNEISIHA